MSRRSDAKPRGEVGYSIRAGVSQGTSADPCFDSRSLRRMNTTKSSSEAQAAWATVRAGCGPGRESLHVDGFWRRRRAAIMRTKERQMTSFTSVRCQADYGCSDRVLHGRRRVGGRPAGADHCARARTAEHHGGRSDQLDESQPGPRQQPLLGARRGRHRRRSRSLTERWSYEVAAGIDIAQVTPLVIDGVMYFHAGPQRHGHQRGHRGGNLEPRAERGAPQPRPRADLRGREDLRL